MQFVNFFALVKPPSVHALEFRSSFGHVGGKGVTNMADLMVSYKTPGSIHPL